MRKGEQPKAGRETAIVFFLPGTVHVIYIFAF
jgi:hypothetical protein